MRYTLRGVGSSKMSKKLINEPERVVDESLSGLVAVNSGLKLLEGHRVVVRADIQDVVKEGKVTLLCGGGSGHEPAHWGYVGRGMLTAMVGGPVFTSPPPSSILAALRAIQSPAGTLMIVYNYTGDRLTFGIALERARSEGMKVSMVIVGEDCALPSSDVSAGRRGLCGVILVHKIAGAMAERGCSLEEVKRTAEQIAKSMGTMGVSLSPCSVPGSKPSFHLEEDEMEIGLGVHGEAGVERSKVQPADNVVERLINQIVSQEPGYQYFKAEPGMNVAVIVNNLGGTSCLELYIVANSAIRYLVDQLKLNVVRVYVGSLMTSLEMAGVSLTLLHMLPGLQWKELLDFPTTACGWPNTFSGNTTATSIESTILPIASSGRQSNSQLDQCGQEPVTNIGTCFRDCIAGVCSALTSKEEVLNELDRGSGDGDCGSTLKAGVTAIQENLSRIKWDEPQQALLSLASIVGDSMGGSSGAIYNLFLSAGAAELGDTSRPLSWAKALQDGMLAVMKYGGAKPGYRTMLDALNPAVDVLMRDLAGSESHEQALRVLKMAVQAAKSGAEETIKMKARAGRASYVNVTQLTQKDPGAEAVAVWLEAVYDKLN